MTPGRCSDDPRHPYTVGLLRCIPRGGVRKDRERLDTIPGFLPPARCRHLPGCVFADRCALARGDLPGGGARRSIPLGGGHASRCHFHERAQALPHELVPHDAAGGARPRQRRRAGRHARSREQDVPTGRPRRPGAGGRLARDRVPGETLGLVGESGQRQDDARPRPARTDRARRRIRASSSTATRSPPRIGKRDNEQVRALQIVFQNPDAALNRRFSVRRIIGRALTKLVGVRGAERDDAPA